MLRAFHRTEVLPPGMAETVTFALSAREVSTWSVQASAWVKATGLFKAVVASSSRDHRLEGAFVI